MIPVMPELFKSVLQIPQPPMHRLGWCIGLDFCADAVSVWPLLGTLSDRVGRKPVILISLIVMVGYYLIMAVAQTVWLLLIGRIVGGITAATHATASAYVADISTSRKRPRVLGLSGRPLVWGLCWGLFGRPVG